MSNDLQNVQMDEEQPSKQEVSLPPPPKTKFGERFQKNIILLKAVLGETLCTFLFIFIVTATAYNNSRLSSSQYTSVPLIEALCTGFCSVALIFSFADVSGAHFNPAVSFATFITGKIDILKFLFFVVAQLVGATLASIMLLICYPGWSLRPVKEVVVRRHGEASIYEAFVMEMILTFILVYVIFATAFDKIENQNVKVDIPDDYADLMEEGKQIEAAQTGVSTTTAAPKKKKPVMPRLTIYSSGGQFAPIAIGFTLGFLNFIGGTVSGGCYNPARAFGPALIAMEWTDHWIYWIADFLGAGLAGYCQMIFAHNQPDPLALFRPIINFIKRRRGQAV